jgi:type I restriction enzyme, S subunit
MTLPHGWQELPLNRIVRMRSGDFISNDDIEPQGAHPVYGGNGFRGFTDHFNTCGPIVLVGRQGAHCGNVHVADGLIWVSEHALRCFPEKELDAKWLAYALRDMNLNQYSVSAAQPGLSIDNLKHLRTAVPPVDAQRRIAGFLDEKTARIDELIEKKHALLDRLTEKRQALITRAVTKGLNPDAPMKPSGIDWIGDIPVHWEVKRLKYISPRVSVGIVVTPAAYYADEGVLAIRGLNVRPMGFDFTDSRNLSEEGHQTHLKSEIYEDDLVAVRTGDPGTTAVITADLEGTNCVDLVIIRKPRNGSSRFLGWFLNSDAAKVQYAIGSEGALQLHFNVETSKEVTVALPPNEEQMEIADYIDRGLEYENDRARKVERSVALLKEYRAALITAAVTGQLVHL